MDTTALFLLLAFNISLRTATSEMEAFSPNGWRPISGDKVFSDHWQNKMTSPEWLHTANNRDFIKIVDAPFLNAQLMTPKIMDSEQNRINNNNNKDTNLVLPINEDVIELKNMEIKNSNDIPIRRGKKMEIKSNYNSNNRFEDKNDDLTTKDNELENNNEKIYKVIEDTNDDDLLSSNQNAFVSKDNYGLYEEDKKGNNFTNSFWKILSNYNIKSGDRLPNYALSLRQNSRIPNSGYVYMQVPIRIPIRHNSANHAPVDPLLAVFLSNYGHYLPGVFGFQQNYRNLYGYLASNNIHNNKPFGAYKILADTDSSL